MAWGSNMPEALVRAFLVIEAPSQATVIVGLLYLCSEKHVEKVRQQLHDFVLC